MGVYYMRGAPEGSTERIMRSGEAGNRTWPVAPGLQGIALIHYNTAVSWHRLPETSFTF